jgi:hypothetical protein
MLAPSDTVVVNDDAKPDQIGCPVDVSENVSVLVVPLERAKQRRLPRVTYRLCDTSYAAHSVKIRPVAVDAPICVVIAD